MESKKIILVVDDELQTRKIAYASALDTHYDVTYTDNADLVYDVIRKSNADLFLVDLDLSDFIDPNTNSPMYVQNVLNAIGTDKPVILLSASYDDLMKNGKLTPIIRNSVERGYNICSFFAWSEIQNVADKFTDKDYRDALYSKLDFMIQKDRHPYDFGIVCALESELQPFMDKALSGSVSEIVKDEIHYKRAVLKTKSGRKLNFIAACSSYMGIADSSIIATNMVTRFGVEKIYMVGVCGGRESEGVKIGDVIIPMESVAYQRGKLTNYGFSSDIMSAKPREGGVIKCSDANDILNELFKEYLSNYIQEEGKSLAVERPKVYYNVMACADYVIDKDDELDKIADTISKRKLCAVDMESYGIFRTGELMNINTMVIKSVMDLTNNKSDKYKPYASYLAANYLYQLLFHERF